MSTLPLAGNLPRGANASEVIQFPTGYTCSDATASPLTSPQTASGALTLVAPAKSFGVVVRATGDFKYGNTAAYAGGYMYAAANADTYLPVVDGNPIILTPVSGTITIYFAFMLTV